MIQVSVPSQSPFGTAFLHGLQVGNQVTESPDDIAQQRARTLLTQMQAKQAQAMMQSAPQANKMKLALLAAQLHNAQTTPFQRNLQTLQAYQAPQQQPQQQGSFGAMPPPQMASLGEQGAQQPSGGVPPQMMGTPQQLSGPLSSMMAQSGPTEQSTFGGAPPGSALPPALQRGVSALPPSGDPNQMMGGYGKDQLMQALVAKNFGMPPPNPQRQAFYAQRAAQSLASQRGAMGQAAHLANASDQELEDMGFSPKQLEPLRTAYAATVINQLPADQKIQWTSGTDFINQFDQHLKPQTEKFMQDLKMSGLTGIGKLEGSKLGNVLGRKNPGLYDEYQNLLKMWSVAVSDYRKVLGDKSTKDQLAYVNAILQPNIKTMTIPGVLKNYNNLMDHTDTTLKKILNTSQLAAVKDHLHYRSPQSFDIPGENRAQSYQGGVQALARPPIPASIKNKAHFQAYLASLSPAQQYAYKRAYGGNK